MYYSVNSYRFITQKYGFSKISKKHILTVALQNTQKSASNDFKKTFPTYFFMNFLQHFSNRPYPNVKIILAYFDIIKTIQNFLPLRVLDALLALLRVLPALNLSDSLDFSDESPCIYAKLRTPFLMNSVVSSQFPTSSKRKFNLTIN